MADSEEHDVALRQAEALEWFLQGRPIGSSLSVSPHGSQIAAKRVMALLEDRYKGIPAYAHAIQEMATAQSVVDLAEASGVPVMAVARLRTELNEAFERYGELPPLGGEQPEAALTAYAEMLRVSAGTCDCGPPPPDLMDI